jgi:wobble nucleotide-excising tRNase
MHSETFFQNKNQIKQMVVMCGNGYYFRLIVGEVNNRV